MFDRIDLEKTWDDPVNSKLHEASIDVYRCPGLRSQDNKTSYLAVVGPGGAFTGADSHKLMEFENSASKVMAIVEVTADRAVPWMAPEDITVAELLEWGPGDTDEPFWKDPSGISGRTHRIIRFE